MQKIRNRSQSAIQSAGFFLNSGFRASRTACLALVLALVGGFSVQAQTSNALPSLEALVGQWVDLRAQIATEDREGKAQITQLQREIDLLNAEKAALQAEQDAASRDQQGVDQEELKQAALRDQLQGALNRLPPILDRAEADLARWKLLIPPALLPPLQESFRQLPATADAARRRPVSERLQLVVALYAQIEEIQDGMHVAKEILTDNTSTRREMDVLYLGLARGFAVSTAGDWAAVGCPTPDGWQWNGRPELASRVRTAIRVQQRQQVAEAVPLPLAVVVESE